MIGVIICTDECNLCCGYCYEHTTERDIRFSRSEINSIFNKNVDKTDEYVALLSNLAKKYGRTVQVILHGGEPLLVNTDELEKLFYMIKTKGDIAIQIQTNGTLITQQTAEMFSEYDVGVVVSLDGPEAIHNQYRVNASGIGTFSRVMGSVELLKENKVYVSALATITDRAVNSSAELYAFFNSINIDFSVNRCFSIPCKKGGISEEEYKLFLSELYDLYCSREQKQIRIPCFDRCIHDLTKDNDGYCYYPRVAPYISVYNIPTGSYGCVSVDKSKKFGSLETYQMFAEKEFGKTVHNNVIKYNGLLKDCVVSLLCDQQNEDFLNAEKFGV